MTVTVKANEAKEEEKVEVLPKEKASDKLKAKAEKGKSFISRNKAKIGAIIGSVVGAIVLGTLTMIAKEKVDSGEWDIPNSDSSSDEDEPFEETDI